jgi:MYXO-CTERM domain-containing protein
VRHVLPIACVLAVALGLPTGARADLADDHTFPCVGRWQGVGQNTGFPSRWTIDMTVRPPDGEGRCGTIEYTSPRCGGTMEACRVEGGRVHVRERYTHDEGGCAAAAELEFGCEGDRMDWAWLGWEVARSTLTRVGPAPGRTDARPNEPAIPDPPRPSERDDLERGPRRADTFAPERPSGGSVSFAGCGCAVHGASARAPFAFVIVALIAAATRRRPR